MSWFSRKKKEEPKKEEKVVEQTPVENSKESSEENPNLIYRGPMSGMSEAIKKFNETGEKTGDIRE
tara:strand:- start:341 stop:538 length:198 start_codon:yes stop_codon:yes gene_type:complete